MKETEYQILLVNILAEDLPVLNAVLKTSDFSVKEVKVDMLSDPKTVDRESGLVLLGVHDDEGLSAFKRLNSDSGSPFSFLLLASREELEKIELSSGGIVEYILKPISPKEIIHRIRTCFEMMDSRLKLQQCEKHLADVLVEKDNFVSVASHDLKNPINVISGIIELMNMTFNTLTSEDLKEYMYMIERSCQRMKQITGNLLDIHRIEAGKLKINICDFSPQHLLIDLIKSHTLHAHEKDITLNFAGDYPALVLNSDFDLVFQILDNLLSNAIKYSPKEKQVYIELIARDEHIVFKIRDEGPGFTEKDKGLLFQKFVKLSAQPTGDEVSTGLGLSIVKQLTGHLYGEIKCHSQPGEGAEFELTLPIKFPLESHIE